MADTGTADQEVPAALADLDGRIRRNVRLIIKAKGQLNKTGAARLGMTAQMFSNMLRGRKRTLRPSHLAELAEWLELDVSVFYARSDDELAALLGMTAGELVGRLSTWCFQPQLWPHAVRDPGQG